MLSKHKHSKNCLIKIVQIRTACTSEDHGLGGLEPWQGFHRLLLQVKCVTDLGLLHILHPCYHVAHLACIPAHHSSTEWHHTTVTVRVNLSNWLNQDALGLLQRRLLSQEMQARKETRRNSSPSELSEAVYSQEKLH